ncbi:uncharacterized protein LOC110933670 [Helianthus annuus]|uniref:uncharacterized protein LOC110933670 n=1 Tax=Helianthus annuus TaxID=4232 RepID=UPI000B8FDACA|nr:uncharacterized protein LOC110933670 [Helianthus annuus]
MSFHIHSIVSGRKSLWVEWIRSYRLKERSFWDIPDPRNACWSWRKLLQIRPLVRKFFWSKIGNGQNTSLWYDMWCEDCPLSRYVSPRHISREGLSIYSRVADVVVDNNWQWPEAWRDLFPILFQLNPVQIHSNKTDTIAWKDSDGKLVPFSTKLAWDAIRRREQKVLWDKAVWTSCWIPRHAFHLWLVFREKLWTQDRIRNVQIISNGSMNMMCCMLCFNNLESHSHLYFECEYSAKVWNSLKVRAELDDVSGRWEDVAEWMNVNAKLKSVKAVIGKLLVAAITYFLWQERNSRLHNNQPRPPEKLVEIISETIRLKLHSFKYKRTDSACQILREWKITSMEVFLAS